MAEANRTFQRVEDLFDRALELPSGERATFLAAECGDDAALRGEVEQLLASLDGAGTALRSTVAAAAGALVADQLASHVGRRLGPYRLVELIGEGGMGTVYLAERDDAQYKRRVAIKILQHGLASPAVIARFRDERQILAALEHPAIVRLLDGGSTDDNLPYLVMEYVEGVPLARHARTLSVRARVELVVRVCAALSYAHGKLVVHRDIKPSNILVDREGAPKLLDFGIAKLMDPSAGGTSSWREAKTRTGVALLTPEYASPEQARGEPVSVATDVYSLGAVLYDLLVGRPPQTPSDSVLETLRTICERDPPRPSVAGPPELRRQLAGDLDNIVMRALHKQPASRYPSVAAFADDLQRYLDGLPVIAREATFAYRARKFVRRHRGALAIATLVTAALATATVVSVVQARRADEQARHAEAQTLTLLEEQGRRELANGHPGRALPYLVEALRLGDDTPAMRFLVAEAARPFERRIGYVEKLADGVATVAWIANGAQVLVAGYNGRARIYRSDGTLLRAVGLDHPILETNQVFRLATSHDGLRIAVTTSRGIEVWDLARGIVLATIDGRYDSFDQLAVDRDGARLAWIAFEPPRANEPAAGPLWTMTLGTRVRTRVAERATAAMFSNDGAALYYGDATGAIHVWDVAAGAERARWPPARGAVAYLVSSHDGTRLLVSRTDGTSEIRTIAHGDTIGALAGHGFGFSPDDTRVATTTPDNSGKLWDARTGRLLASLVGHDVGIRTLDFSPDGKRIVTAGGDATFRLWNATTGALEDVIEATSPPSDTPHSVPGAIAAQFSPDGSKLVTATATEVMVWRTTREPLLAQLTPDRGYYAVRYAPDERTVATAGQPEHAEIRDAVSGAVLARLPEPPSPGETWDVYWHPHGDELAIAGSDGYAAIVTPRGDVRRLLVGHRKTINHVAYSADGTRVATACDDYTARIWNPATGAQIASLPHPHRVMSVAWDATGARLATAGWDRTLRVWDVDTATITATFHGGATQFLDVVFSPDGTRLASAGHGGEVAIWNIATGERERAFDGHTGPVTTVAWSPDGAMLASSGDDARVLVWDVASGKLLATRMHRGGVMQVVWNRAGTRLLAAYELSLWDVARSTRTITELDRFVADHIPWRLVEGRLESATGR